MKSYARGIQGMEGDGMTDAGRVFVVAVLGILGLGVASYAEDEEPPGDQDAAWAPAIEQIHKSEKYGGLRLPLQKGLIPLGPDPSSDLHEFAVEGSGTVPKRDPESKRLVLADDFAIVLVLLPGGTFWMGSQSEDPKGPNYTPDPADEEEQVVRRVTLSPFFLAKFECTQAQWRELSGREPEWEFKGPRLPATLVSWSDGWTTLCGRGLDLPSEAQWEYACRAGTSTPWWTGADGDALREAAWFEENSDYTVRPVGEKLPNASGLHDVHGNVSEWCLDAWMDVEQLSRTPSSDPVVRGGVGEHVCRGGGASDEAGEQACSYRYHTIRWHDDEELGLRPSRVVRADEHVPSEVGIPEWAKVSKHQIAEAKWHGVPVAVENAFGMRFVLVPAGRFSMGSPDYEPGRGKDEAQRRVMISRPFYMQVTEVTNAQYRHHVPAHDSDKAYKEEWGESAELNDDAKPVVNVTWRDAQEFVAWLARRDPNRVYALPTEAQWEYACRAGTAGRFWWGPSALEARREREQLEKDPHWDHPLGYRVAELQTGKYENVKDGKNPLLMLGAEYRGLLVEDGHRFAAPVGSLAPNAWGLYDMAGNVCEFCSDWYGSYDTEKATDPSGPPESDAKVVEYMAEDSVGGESKRKGPGRVVRGGSWCAGLSGCRAAKRDVTGPSDIGSALGFRLVLLVPQQGK